MQVAPVFLDTSALIAAAATRDQNHARSVEAFRDLAAAGRPFLTTNSILAEAYTLARRRVGHAAAVKIASSLMSGRDVAMVRVSEGQERKALDLLPQQADKAYSFADATSFVVMKENQVTEALTFDQDFAQAGFAVLPHR